MPGILRSSIVFLITFFLFVFGINEVSWGQTATINWLLTTDGNPVTIGNVSANSISGGMGISGISFGGSGASASGWNAETRQNDDYYEYSISPVTGYTLTITNISFQQYSTSNKDESGAIYYSKNGFLSSSQIGGNFTVQQVQATTTFNSLNIQVNSGETLTIRIYAWGLQKTNDLFYNENVIITGTTNGSVTPFINLTTSNIDFGYVDANTASAEIMYQVSGENLDGTAVNIVAPADFEISLSSGSGFTNSITLSYSGNTLPQTTIYCRFSPTLNNSEYNDNISHDGGGATAQNVSVTGTTIVDCTTGAVALYSSSGVTDFDKAIGETDLNGAIITGNNGILTLDLTGDGFLSPGVPVDIYWNSGHPSQAGQVLVEVSEDASVWTTVNSYSVNSGDWSTQNISLITNTRYIRLTSINNRDVLIDAVEFDSPPTIVCPADVNVNVDSGTCTATSVDLGTPATADNCGVASITNDALTIFPLGTTVVLWSVTDIAGNLTTCTQNVTVIPEEEIDLQVVDIADFCQSGQTGTTTITWNIQLIGGTNNWTYDFTINDGNIDVDTGIGLNATGDITISYTMNNQENDKTFTLTLSNVTDECGIAETVNINNTDDVTVYAVPATGEIIPD